MINLLIGLVLVCSTLGVTISKTTTKFGVRKQREHTQHLKIDKEIF